MSQKTILASIVHDPEIDALFQEAFRTPDYWAGLLQGHLIADTLDLMEEQNVSKAELARRMGISRQRVHQILSENVNLTLETIAQLALALGCRPVVRLQPLKSTPQPRRKALRAPCAAAPPRQAVKNPKNKRASSARP